MRHGRSFGIAACSLLASLVPSPGWAATLTVGPGGTFADIQSAIDAAFDGDLILVEPGTYDPFVIALKGVTVQAESSFTVDNTSGSGVVRILGVPAGQKAAIKGMDLVAALGGGVGLQVEFSPGEVIIERTTITDPSGRAFFGADNCSRLFVSELTITGSPFRLLFPAMPTVPLRVDASSASFYELTINGGGTFECASLEGGSKVVMAASRITAVHGVDSSGCLFDPDGGIGGAGVIVEDSSLVVTGDATHFISGGEGGDGAVCGTGGNGGPGLRVLGASNVVVADRVALLGGPGGVGGVGNGNPGDPADGPVDHTQSFPLLALDDDLSIGGSASIVIDAVPSGASSLTVLALLSGEGGFLDLAAFGGPPASALTLGPFLFFVGVTDPAGDITFPVSIPNDPSLVAFPVHVQAAVADPLGPNFLTNVVVRGISN